VKRIKAGFVGAGFVGPIHIENLRRLGIADVVALAEIDQKKADELADRLSIKKAYGKWEDLISDDEVEVVHVTCSNDLHYPVSKACIEAGKNVICEKPLSMSIEEAKELVSLAKKKNVVNATTFNMEFYPMVKEAIAIISRGDLGRIYLVFGRLYQDWLSKDSDYNWRVESKYQGKTRVVADLGSHWFHIIQKILNKRIISVFGDRTIFIPVRKRPTIEIPTFSEQELKPGEYEEIEVDTEDHATVLLRFEDNIKGIFVGSQVSPGRKNRLEWEVSGSLKSLAWQQEDPNQLWIGYRNKANELLLRDPSLLSENVKQFAYYPGGLAEGYGDSWKNLLNKIYKYILEEGNLKGKVPDFPTFKDGYENMVIIESIWQSMKKNEWIDINWELY